MNTDHSQIFNKYLSLSLKERQIIKVQPCIAEIIENKNRILKCVCSSPIEAAANEIYTLFTKMKIARKKTWISHEQYETWLYELKSFLLDPDLFCAPGLAFLELIEEVNTFIL